MQNNKNKEHKKLLDSGRLLFFLSALFLVGSLLPAAIGSSGTTVIDSSGSVTYTSPPPPPPSPPPDGEWLAWTDFGPPTTVTNWQENNGMRLVPRGCSIVSGSGYPSPTHCLRVYRGSDERAFLFATESVADWRWAYMSAWFYLPSTTLDQASWEEFIAWYEDWHASYGRPSTWPGDPFPPFQYGARLDISPYGSGGNKYWRLAYVTHQSARAIPGTFWYNIYSDSYTGWNGGDVYAESVAGCGGHFITHKEPATYLEINPHPVPADRWFRLTVWTYRDRHNGELIVWITDPALGVTDKKMFHAEGIWTAYGDPLQREPVHGSEAFIFELTKVYGLIGPVYVDDVYIARYNAHAES